MAGSIAAGYFFGRSWTPWVGTLSALLTLAWLGLLPLAAVMLVLDFVRNRKTLLVVLLTALLFALLVVLRRLGLYYFAHLLVGDKYLFGSRGR